ncbi:histidine kinase [Fictibacillus enclensis]|uniref:sensor histidine kinase n=1 Tax=Fictibacillus enclensis TaxID=1017270 RepID=UPI0025A269C8|nr:histidine kinase [Fictibacillus enclensis]MDM5336428.1 histidine kinase [Fictibacillus enclensis]
MSDAVFTLLILGGIGLPVAAYVTLLLLGFFEKELDYLQVQNKRIEMEKELHRMEYLQLNQQIQPHFMFNSLNAMLSLNRLGRTKDVSYALEEFSQFLRYKYVNKESLVAFEEELAYTSHYLSIQKIRFGKQLTIRLTIDEQARRTHLPPYVLQTLVENAFKHGLEKKKGEKELSIALERMGSWVELRVSDNGPGPAEPVSQTEGVGLENIRKRLSLIYDLYTEVNLSRRMQDTVVRAVWPYTPEGEK